MATQLPKVYYGLHFVPGVAEYSGPDDRIYVSEETAKAMDKTFQGCPVYTKHVDKVNLENIQTEADGYVIESFFNPNDGKHWAKFVVVSDDGHQKIKDGWRLSNGYTVKKDGPGGKNHNVDYKYEVTEGQYSHLAIVQDPRYEESIILTPEQFKEYNEGKKKNLVNSKTKKGYEFMFKFFAKKEIENSKEIAETVVTLANGKEVSVSELVTLVNKMNSDDKDADDAKKKNEADEEEKKKKEEEEKKKNEAEEEAKKKKEEEDKKKKEEEDKKNALEKEAKLNEIKNAMDIVEKGASVDLTHNQVARGNKLYGSNK